MLRVGNGVDGNNDGDGDIVRWIVRTDSGVISLDGGYTFHDFVVAYGNSVIGVALYVYFDGDGTSDVICAPAGEFLTGAL